MLDTQVACICAQLLLVKEDLDGRVQIRQSVMIHVDLTIVIHAARLAWCKVSGRGQAADMRRLGALGMAAGARGEVLNEFDLQASLMSNVQRPLCSFCRIITRK